MVFAFADVFLGCCHPVLAPGSATVSFRLKGFVVMVFLYGKKYALFSSPLSKTKFVWVTVAKPA